MADEPADAVDEYRSYLQRCDELLGPCEFGAYAKYKGKLVKKLTFDEFEKRWQEYGEVDRAYEETVQRGDTMNDILVRVLRERSAELLIERKILGW